MMILFALYVFNFVFLWHLNFIKLIPIISSVKIVQYVAQVLHVCAKQDFFDKINDRFESKRRTLNMKIRMCKALHKPQV